MLRNVLSAGESLRVDDFVFIGKVRYQIVALTKIDNVIVARLTDNFEFIDPQNDIMLSIPCKKIIEVQYEK